MASKWIQKAIKKPGSLRKSLGVKKGQKIPAKKLNAAAKKGGNSKSAATAINTKSKASPTSDISTNFLRESQVNKMSDKEYEKNQDSILEAMRSGKFVYDLSGAAR